MGDDLGVGSGPVQVATQVAVVPKSTANTGRELIVLDLSVRRVRRRLGGAAPWR